MSDHHLSESVRDYFTYRGAQLDEFVSPRRDRLRLHLIALPASPAGAPEAEVR